MSTYQLLICYCSLYSASGILLADFEILLTAYRHRNLILLYTCKLIVQVTHIGLHTQNPSTAVYKYLQSDCSVEINRGLLFCKVYACNLIIQTSDESCFQTQKSTGICLLSLINLERCGGRFFIWS